jgi:hypothetical protein
MSQLTTSRLGYTYNILTWSRATFRDGSYRELAEAGYFADGESVVVAVKQIIVGDTTYKFEFVSNYELEGSAVGFFTAIMYNNDRGYPAEGTIIAQGLSYRTQDYLDYWEHVAMHNYFLYNYTSAV